ncbi:MAG TPA: hypothetical protein ENK52_02775, partial [Saprospiraceae bacterium]|nr:hypothetical protein [Saprospiraceae bacterium]
MKRIFLSFLFIAGFSFLYGQTTHPVHLQLKWDDEPIIHNPFELDVPMEILSFDGAIYQNAHPTLPVAATQFQVPSKGKLS